VAAVAIVPLPAARLCFVHEVLPLFRDTANVQLAGHATPGKDEVFDCGGLTAASQRGAFDAIFAGHDHHSDFVRWSPHWSSNTSVVGGAGLLLGHGRCGSFFPPSEHEGRKPLPFLRGARVYQVDLSTAEGVRDVLSTWTVDEGEEGVARNVVRATLRASAGGLRGVDCPLPVSGAEELGHSPTLPNILTLGLVVVAAALLWRHIVGWCSSSSLPHRALE
jgi:hypothetical protein